MRDLSWIRIRGINFKYVPLDPLKEFFPIPRGRWVLLGWGHYMRLQVLEGGEPLFLVARNLFEREIVVEGKPAFFGFVIVTVVAGLLEDRHYL